MVSLLIDLLYERLQLPLDIMTIKTREMSEPNSQKYLPAKISTYTEFYSVVYLFNKWATKYTLSKKYKLQKKKKKKKKEDI